MGTVLGFDYGAKRIGIAVGQSITGSANPLPPAQRTHDRPDWAVIDAAVAEWRPEALVVGLPRHADDTPHTLAKEIEAFCSKLRKRFGQPVHTIDERLTSHEARQRVGGTGPVDSVAAALILETWLAEQ